jgi:hypothetical protein
LLISEVKKKKNEKKKGKVRARGQGKIIGAEGSISDRAEV